MQMTLRHLTLVIAGGAEAKELLGCQGHAGERHDAGGTVGGSGGLQYVCQIVWNAPPAQ